MIKKLFCVLLATAAPVASADATVVTINFESLVGDRLNEATGSFSYDTSLLPRDTGVFPGLFNVAEYSIGTFDWTVAGFTFSLPVIIQVADSIGAAGDALYAFMQLGGGVNLNFVMEWPNVNFPGTKFDGTALPGNVDGANSGIVLVDTVNNRLLALQPATYTVTYSNAAVPEPASWAMMIAGFGVVGGAMRRRANRSSVTFA